MSELPPANASRTPTEPVESEDPALTSRLRDWGPGHVVFDRFRLERELGEGGMGVVWLVRDQRLDERPTALKFLTRLLAGDAEALLDLRREIRHGLDVTHLGIVRVHDLHEQRSERLAAIAMEYVDGKTLTDLKNERPDRCFEPGEILPWLRQLCETLTYLHDEVGLVHRDLKPRNLMLSRTGRLKLADFGIAAAINESHSRLTRSHEMRTSGTPCYMSPQQVKGLSARPSDDLYALGATIYELLTGKPPFFYGGAAAILHQVLHECPPTICARRAEMKVTGRPPVLKNWEALVAALLEKDPLQRPANAWQVYERLSAPPVEPERHSQAAASRSKRVEAETSADFTTATIEIPEAPTATDGGTATSNPQPPPDEIGGVSSPNATPRPSAASRLAQVGELGRKLREKIQAGVLRRPADGWIKSIAARLRPLADRVRRAMVEQWQKMTSRAAASDAGQRALVLRLAVSSLVVLVVFICIVAGSLWEAAHHDQERALLPPQRTGHFSDPTNVLDANTRGELGRLEYEPLTARIFVHVVPKLPEQDADAFARRLLTSWGPPWEKKPVLFVFADPPRLSFQASSEFPQLAQKQASMAALQPASGEDEALNKAVQAAVRMLFPPSKPVVRTASAPVAASTPKPLLPFVSVGATTQEATWKLYPAGKLPPGKTISAAQAAGYLSGTNSSAQVKERLYLTGDFTVTAAGDDRAVLRPSLDGKPETGSFRVVVEYCVKKPPLLQAVEHRGPSNGYEVREIRLGADEQITVYARETVQ